MLNQILAAIYYSYPVALCVTLFLSYLFFRQPDETKYQVVSRRKYFRCIFFLQVCLLLSLAGSMTIWVQEVQVQLPAESDLKHFQAQIASYIALFVYFGSGLLPDPEGPFRPNAPHLYTWLMATAFELALIILLKLSPWEARNADFAIGLGGLRILIFLAMAIIFSYQDRRFRWKIFEGDLERRSLLRDDALSSTVKSVGSDSKTRLQTVGWISYFFGFRRLFPYIWPSDSPIHQFTTVICFTLLIIQRVVNIMVPRQLGILVDALGVGRIPYKEIVLYCLYRSFQGQQGVIGSSRAILWIPISQSLYCRLTSAAYEHVLLLSLDFHLSKKIGEVISALSKGGSLNTFLDGFAFQLFPMIVDLGMAAIYLFITFDAFYSIIVIAVMWNYVFATIYMAKYRGKARREMAKREREMEAVKTDAIMAYETVHYNNAIPLELSKFRTLVHNFQRAEYSVLFSLNALNALQNGIFMVGVILVSGLSAYQISIRLHKVADFVTIITYFAQLHAPLAFFGSFYNQVQNNLVDAERMLELFNTKPDVIDAEGAKPIDHLTGKVSVSNLSFSYGVGRPALENVTFQIEPGSSIAIVGESGSGKSTILKLLYRFYNADAGEIRIDDLSTEKITIDSLRSHMGVVPQETILFNDTLMQNLIYANPAATREEIFQACRTARIHDKILSFPDGYNTLVGERGLKLSGGEKQRVAIARAILKDPQIMLFDEATASLDTKTEKLIQDALDKATKGRTTITVAHRLSTITRADQILLLHKGQVVERGTHEVLLAQGGRYAAMWENQTGAERKIESMR